MQICLYNINQPMLILSTPSGVSYFNQVGGQLCFQAHQEGVLVPLEMTASNVSRLEEFPYAQGAMGIDVSAANFIDEILQSNVETAFLKVDRRQLDAALEAWVHVVVDHVPASFDINDVRFYGPLFGTAPGSSGVITWANSD
jgi:hypothetical protein